MRCEQFEAVASELALGLLDGHERAEALAHLDGCASCRALAEELAGAADAVLLVAPSAEPPAGFEARVLARLDPKPEARRAWQRPLLGVAAAVLLAVAVVAVVRARSSDDGSAGREHIAVGSMATPDGEHVGIVFVDEETPRLVHIRVNRWNRQGVDYYVKLDYEDGETTRLLLQRVEGGFDALLPDRAVPLTTVSMVTEEGKVLCSGTVEY